MNVDDNIKTIRTIYEAFGRGDVEAIIASLADDVDWAAEASGTAAPWYGVCRGPGQVAEFFSEFASTMEVSDFTPTVYAGSGDDVLTVVRFAGTSRATGRRVAMDLHHHFRFRDGRIAFYRGTEDTAQVASALHP